MSKRLLLLSTKAWRCRVWSSTASPEWNVQRSANSLFSTRYFASSSKPKVESTASSKAKAEINTPSSKAKVEKRINTVSSQVEAEKSLKTAKSKCVNKKTEKKQVETRSKRAVKLDAKDEVNQTNRKGKTKVAEESNVEVVKPARKKAEPKLKQEGDAKPRRRATKKSTTEDGDEVSAGKRATENEPKSQVKKECSLDDTMNLPEALSGQGKLTTGSVKDDIEATTTQAPNEKPVEKVVTAGATGKEDSVLEAPKDEQVPAAEGITTGVEPLTNVETTGKGELVVVAPKEELIKKSEVESGSSVQNTASPAEQEHPETDKRAEQLPDGTSTTRAVENVKVVEGVDEDFQGVDEELKEFLQMRKQQQEEEESMQGEEDESDIEYDYEWDYREVRNLPEDVKLLDKKLKQLVTEAPEGDRRTAMVKLKLALELCKTDGSSHDAQRAVDLANDALKVLGIGANDYSMEQGICLSALGAGYRKLEQRERSLSYLKRALRYFDEKEEKGIEVVRERQFVLNELGLTHSSMGNVKQAVEALTESLELLEAFLPFDDPSLGDELRKAAAHLCDVQEWSEAKKQCEKAIRVHSRSRGYDNEDVGQDRKIMARIYRGLNQHEQALEQFRIARQIFAEDKDNVYWANMGIADSQLALGSVSEAIATLEGTFNSVPKKPVTLRGAAYLKLAKAFYLKNNHEQARRRLSEALEFYKGNLSAGSLMEIASQLHEVAALFDAMGDVKGSITTLKLAVAAYDCVPGGESMLINAKMDLGSQLISHGEAEAALGYYKQALALAESLNKVSPNVLTLTAIAHMTLENHQAAVQLLERAEASADHQGKDKQAASKGSLVEPGFIKLPVYQNLARCYRALGRLEDAIKYQKLVVAELQMIGGETEEKRIHDAVRMLEELSEKVELSCAVH